MTAARSFDEAAERVRQGRERTALHEAAHVVAAWQRGIYVGSVALLGTGGHTTMALWSGPRSDVDPESALVAIVAGAAAEAIADYPSPWRGTTGPGNAGDAHDAARLAEAAGLDAGPAIRTAIRTAAGLLSQNWEATVELADGLMAEPYLAGSEVDAALAAALERAPRRRPEHDVQVGAVDRALASWDSFVDEPARIAARIARSIAPRAASPAAATPARRAEAAPSWRCPCATCVAVESGARQPGRTPAASPVVARGAGRATAVAGRVPRETSHREATDAITLSALVRAGLPSPARAPARR